MADMSARPVGWASTNTKISLFIEKTISVLYALHGNAVLLVISKSVVTIHMQVILQGRPVQEETAKDALLEIMADKYSRAIIAAAMEMPKSAIDLSNDCGIPISTAYRRVQLLHKHKLLGISGSINEDGKKYFLYKSRVKSIVTCFNGGTLDVEIVPNFTDSN